MARRRLSQMKESERIAEGMTGRRYLKITLMQAYAYIFTCKGTFLDSFSLVEKPYGLHV
jgi:hypothetical protein